MIEETSNSDDYFSETDPPLSHKEVALSDASVPIEQQPCDLGSARSNQDPIS